MGTNESRGAEGKRQAQKGTNENMCQRTKKADEGIIKCLTESDRLLTR